MPQRNIWGRASGSAALLTLLLFWETGVGLGAIDRRFFPAPSEIAIASIAMARSGELLANLAASLKRIFFGFILGALPGVFWGVCMGLSDRMRAILEPVIAATYPIPKSALFPLLLLIFGLGEMSKIVMVAIGVFYPVCINAAAGVREIDAIHLDVGKNFKASRWDILCTIAFPGALPFVMAGVRLGLGMGLVFVTLAEMIGAKSGIGYLIWSSWEIFAIEKMYVGIFSIALTGLIFNKALTQLEGWLIPWKTTP